MAANQPTQHETKPSTNKDIELLLLYIDSRLKKLERKIEWSLFGAILLLVFLFAPETFGAIVAGIADAIVVVIALIVALFQLSGSG